MTDPELDALLREADVVFDAPGAPGTHQLDPGRAPNAVWVSITPFGLDGPRAHWRATDLGVMAASANMYCTGDPDRAPVRCTEPTGYAHTGPEAAFAALTALWTGVPQRVDVSMQEVVLVANMATPGPLPADRVPRVAARRQHRQDPRDLADDTTGSCRSGCAAARRASRVSS